MTLHAIVRNRRGITRGCTRGFRNRSCSPLNAITALNLLTSCVRIRWGWAIPLSIWICWTQLCSWGAEAIVRGGWCGLSSVGREGVARIGVRVGGCWCWGISCKGRLRGGWQGGWRCRISFQFVRTGLAGSLLAVVFCEAGCSGSSSGPISCSPFSIKFITRLGTELYGAKLRVEALLFWLGEGPIFLFMDSLFSYFYPSVLLGHSCRLSWFYSNNVKRNCTESFNPTAAAVLAQAKKTIESGSLFPNPANLPRLWSLAMAQLPENLPCQTPRIKTGSLRPLPDNRAG